MTSAATPRYIESFTLLSEPQKGSPLCHFSHVDWDNLPHEQYIDWSRTNQNNLSQTQFLSATFDTTQRIKAYTPADLSMTLAFRRYGLSLLQQDLPQALHALNKDSFITFQNAIFAEGLKIVQQQETPEVHESIFNNFLTNCVTKGVVAMVTSGHLRAPDWTGLIQTC